MNTLDQYFGSASVLARRFSHFESRPGQLEMAREVERILEIPSGFNDDNSGQAACLVVEAETGLGKTLAYLIPAVLSSRKVVVSTNTKNLQDQILETEIPFIQKYIDPNLSATCVKGRQNYLCLYRFHQARSTKQTEIVDTSLLGKIERWLPQTRFGDKAELDWLDNASPIWNRVCCQSHFCLGGECPHASACYLNQLRKDAAASRILIVNHHLLFSDLAVRKSGYGEVLPRYDAVIFDEAHHVENVASNFFGHSFSRYQVLDLLTDIERSAQSNLAGDQQQDLLRDIRVVEGLIEQLNKLFPAERGRFPLHAVLETIPNIRQTRDTLLSSFTQLSEQLDLTNAGDEPWEQYRLRVDELANRLRIITEEQFDDLAEQEIRFVHWFERSERNLKLSATPIDVSEDLQETLYNEVQSVVYTSATLSAGGDFSYFSKRVGAPEDSLFFSYSSPFDFENNTRLYIPETNFPEPASPGAPQAIHKRLADLILLSGGRALLLFTSFAAMDRTYHALRDQLDFPLLMQGKAPRRTLLSRFSREKQSVLLGVASFWEGVDVPGDSLSLVVIDKLPFEVPSDPVIMARIERIKAGGGNPFFDFQIPRAILTLRQGAGRLIRRSSDKGVIAILDIRLFSKAYGKRFLKSLPPSPVCRTLDEVESFFASISGKTNDCKESNKNGEVCEQGKKSSSI